jgi:hypothetical protein
MGDPHDDEEIGRRLRPVLGPAEPVPFDQLPALVAGWTELREIEDLDPWLVVAASPPMTSASLARTLAEHPAVDVVGIVDHQIAAALVDGRTGGWPQEIGALVAGDRPVEVEACALSIDDDPDEVLSGRTEALRRRLRSMPGSS